MALVAAPSIHDVLKSQFGYTSFRPYQEDIIQAVLKQEDVLAVLPTGGGKSLCFQLPSLMHGGVTLVVSPLIALMKDQVDSLKSNGIEASFINSSLSPLQIEKRLQRLNEGITRILYVAPERLMMPHFLEWVINWNVKLLAIDEAHCISEWGHDFRPEYRQLAGLRQIFPHIPFVALTATATKRVRQDILEQLQFKNAQQFIASFNRPNLMYRVLPKHRSTQQLLAFLKDRPKESGIVYCLARRTCESIAATLQAQGFSAKPYHAGLSPKERTKNQNDFLRDQTNIICATIAFGMGIHKSNVRFVVHYNLPRNIESYYQETGRAGRDNLSSECLLLYSAGDAAQLRRFIEDKPKESERATAQRQLNELLDYAESSNCRRLSLLNYFGEAWPQDNCQGCDNCLEPRALFDATLPAQKLLSCVFRIRQKSGHQVGLHHTIDVLTGRLTEKVERWGHQNLSTFGIGNEFKKSQWIRLGDELIRKDYLMQTTDGYKTLSLSEKGASALKARTRIELTQPLSSLKPQKSKSVDTSFDSGLFDHLKSLRKLMADERDVPAYIIFSDASLRQMARDLPLTLSDFARISGVGEKKLKEFGPFFLEEIQAYLSDK